ncbi:hypothetical protein PO909_015533 [Leuciscus waleckii]
MCDGKENGKDNEQGQGKEDKVEVKVRVQEKRKGKGNGVRRNEKEEERVQDERKITKWKWCKRKGKGKANGINWTDAVLKDFCCHGLNELLKSLLPRGVSGSSTVGELEEDVTHPAPVTTELGPSVTSMPSSDGRQSCHAFPTPEPLTVMAAVPESALDDTALIIMATAILCIWAANTSTPSHDPSDKMAAIPEPLDKMAAVPEPSDKMATPTPVFSGKVAASTPLSLDKMSDSTPVSSDKIAVSTPVSSDKILCYDSNLCSWTCCFLSCSMFSSSCIFNLPSQKVA